MFCENIDECAAPGLNICTTLQDCLDNTGSYTCPCKDGYFEIEGVCTNVNECDQANACAGNQSCTDTEGSFTCACSAGFEAGAEPTDACTDIKECDIADTCAANQDCTETEGSFTCNCITGFTLSLDELCQPTTSFVKIVITVETILSYIDDLSNQSTESYLEAAASVKALFLTEIESLASDNYLALDELIVSFASSANTGRRRRSEFATASVEITLSSSSDVPADIENLISTAATSAIADGDGALVDVSTSPSVTANIESTKVFSVSFDLGKFFRYFGNGLHLEVF